VLLPHFLAALLHFSLLVIYHLCDASGFDVLAVEAVVDALARPRRPSLTAFGQDVGHLVDFRFLLHDRAHVRDGVGVLGEAQGLVKLLLRSVLDVGLVRSGDGLRQVQLLGLDQLVVLGKALGRVQGVGVPLVANWNAQS